MINIFFYDLIDLRMEMILNRILNKVENIERKVSKYFKDYDRSEVLDKTFLSKFPIKNAEEFLMIETCILNEPDFISKLVIIEILICETRFYLNLSSL